MPIESLSGLATSNVSSTRLRSLTVSDSLPPAWLLWDLALTTLLSAFLLFQVQPLISKFILPWFGGSPAVWTTCLVFFQSLLFCGYAYAHLTSRLLSCRGQAIVHLALIAAAIVLLPIAPSEGWQPTPGMEPTWRILGLLAVSVGLPYFVLSATGPLGQTWFTRAYRQRSPYRLYALSNIGSLTALLTFPVLFEPAFAADVQASLWSWAFVVFGLLCGGVALWIWMNRGNERYGQNQMRHVRTDDAPTTDSERPGNGQRLLWLALPACASVMLLATTNQACQNVAVVPFLWVVPLALYLLTFIICFDREGWYRRGPFAVVAAVLVFLSAGGHEWLADFAARVIPGISAQSLRLDFVQTRILYFATMFMICMVCHGELVRLRPKARYLTEFYLMIAAGGALGGVLVSLIAPRIFPGYWEWNLGLIISFVVAALYLGKALGRPNAWFATRLQNQNGDRALLASSSVAADFAPGLVLMGFVAVAVWQFEAAKPAPENIFQRRNFYGVVKVYEYNDADGHVMQFKSGGVSHGRQWVSDDPAIRLQPVAYYAPETGAGRAIRFFLGKPDLRIGVVGLGAGTLAAYPKQSGQSIKFYEINPEVVTIANTYFTFLKECKGRHEVVLGDARLSMKSEKERGDLQNFDVLVLDAFSGDAPPAHLLTREAFALYREHLRKDGQGIIAVNIKNRYVHLAPVVKAAADYWGFRTTRIWTDENKARLMHEVDYMLLTEKNDDFLAANPPVLAPGASPVIEPAAWTDHYNNLFQLLMTQ
jgi:hypothetical protein